MEVNSSRFEKCERITIFTFSIFLKESHPLPRFFLHSSIALVLMIRLVSRDYLHQTGLLVWTYIVDLQFQVFEIKPISLFDTWSCVNVFFYLFMTIILFVF